MKSNQAVLCGYYGKGNGGDEALLATLLQMLPAHLSPIVLSGNPYWTEQHYGVRAIDRMNWSAVIPTIRQSQYFIWGGGSLIQDATSAISPLYYAGLMALAQQSGLTTIAWAQGIGPLYRPLTRWLAQQVFRRCSQVSVRDRASAQLLTQWNIPYRLAPDPVWALMAQPQAEQITIAPPRVAVVLRPHPQLTPQRLEHLILALIDFQTKTTSSILLLPFQPDRDLALATAVQSRLAGPSQILAVENPRVLKGIFQSVKMTIAMRLHGLIMAVAEGSQCFALSYDPKVNQLMQEANIPGWELAQIPDRPEQITQAWLQVYDQTPPVTNLATMLCQKALIHQELLQVAAAGQLSGG